MLQRYNDAVLDYRVYEESSFTIDCMLVVAIECLYTRQYRRGLGGAAVE